MTLTRAKAIPAGESEPTEPTTPPRLRLRFETAKAHLAAGAFIAVEMTVFALTLPDAPRPWLYGSSVALVSVAALVSSGPRRRVLTMRTALLAGLLAILAYALTLPQTPGTGLGGYATAHIDSFAFVLLMLVLRGRITQAWQAAGIATVACVGYCLLTGDDFAPRWTSLQMSAGLLLAGTLLIISLGRMGRRVAEVQAREDTARAASSTAEISAREQLAHATRLLDTAGPMLTRIAEGAALTDAERLECLVVEAQLRDSVRAPNLAFEPVTGAVRAARLRGVTVVLFDDRPQAPLPAHLAALLFDWTVAALLSASSGTVTVRLLPEGRDSLATVTTDDGTSPSTTELHHGGGSA